MHVEAPPRQGGRIYAEVGRVRAHVGQGDLRRLLHDVAELAREGQAVAPVHGTGLDEQHVAAGPGDGQPGGHPGDGGPVGRLEEEPGPAQPGPYVGASDHDGGRGFTGGEPGGHLAQQPTDLAFEAAHSCLPGVVGGDGPQRFVGHLQLVRP